LRGSRDFASVAHYREFLERLVEQLNAGRRERLKPEMQYLRALPERRLGRDLNPKDRGVRAAG
jgi:hypothetical protein